MPLLIFHIPCSAFPGPGCRRCLSAGVMSMAEGAVRGGGLGRMRGRLCLPASPFIANPAMNGTELSRTGLPFAISVDGPQRPQALCAVLLVTLFPPGAP